MQNYIDKVVSDYTTDIKELAFDLVTKTHAL